MSGTARRLLRPLFVSLCILAGALLAGCSSAPPERVTKTQDPWEGFNRKIYAFNDALDKHVARPVAHTYVRAMPAPARSGIHNVISNVDEPVTVINDALQGKLKQTFQDLGRFLINSTVGLLGWFDVARHVGLPHHDEDLGQTLAVWGVPSGPYLVIPVIGPSSLRDAGGRVGDLYLNPPRDQIPPRWRNGELVVDGLDTRVSLLQLDPLLDEAYDPYTYMRDAYIQNRRYKIYDGNPPESSTDYDYDLPPEDSTSAAPAAATTAPPAGSSAAPAASTQPAPPAATQTPK
ncbi:MAG TPA: VacJ family lipoprotein [Gammaproteobacteria bacterium]|jgi:phospholipid-binding lipoprotein MlaA